MPDYGDPIAGLGFDDGSSLSGLGELDSPGAFSWPDSGAVDLSQPANLDLPTGISIPNLPSDTGSSFIPTNFTLPSGITLPNLPSTVPTTSSLFASGNSDLGNQFLGGLFTIGNEAFQAFVTTPQNAATAEKAAAEATGLGIAATNNIFQWLFLGLLAFLAFKIFSK